jgi:hypothetical protein
MNPPRYWELCDDACVVETTFSYPYGAMNFHGCFENKDSNSQQLYRICKGLSQDEGGRN